MIPRRIVLENFLSFGSPEIEIAFADDEPLWVIGGPNGIGKSAVFDAMTYALYGEHRGGASDHVSLVRHGANNFRVVFEFEFNSAVYRITRNRPRKGSPTHSVERSIDGDWKTLALPAGKDPIKLWSERTLGIGFDAFTASVLLKQGEADKIITARGAERLDILKKILGMEKYEALAERVHDKTRECKRTFENLKKDREKLTAVTDAELEAARTKLAATEDERGRAHAAHAAAIARVPRAEQWASLERESKSLQEKLRVASERVRDAERIRADFVRHDDLTAVVPHLRNILNLRSELATVNEKVQNLEIDHKKLAAAKQASELRTEIGQITSVLKIADEAKTLKDELARFDPDLTEQLAKAKAAVENALASVNATAQARAGADELLKLAKKQQKDFAKIGATCSLCGQNVTGEHIKAERKRLADRIAELEEQIDSLTNQETSERWAHTSAVDKRDRLTALLGDQRSKSQSLADKQQSLQSLGVAADPAELRRQLSEKSTEAQRLDTQAGDQSRADLTTLSKRSATVQADLQNSEQKRASLQGQEMGAIGHLPPRWAGQLDALDANELKKLETELHSLTRSGIVEAHRQLEKDATERQGWQDRLADIGRQIDAIPADSRVPIVEAERMLNAAKSAAESADAVARAAEAKRDQLERDAEQFRNLVEEVKAAEIGARLHHRLDELLGKAGIQRELVRQAEREIVRLANDTAQHLSDGDLTLELESGDDSDDKAFALQVRRGDSATSIGVTYLSGSQKFRVAISVALAIGQFAAGQARPLESVIIDEGFGSLDREGLRAAANELNRLRQCLRRIILVSHQEEFADQFPVVIRLTQGETGTIATAVRK